MKVKQWLNILILNSNVLLKSKIGVKKYDSDVYDRFLQLFCKLPLCALVDNKYFCVHGGISP